MITLWVDGESRDREEFTYHHQDTPWPGGIEVLVEITDWDKVWYLKRYRELVTEDPNSLDHNFLFFNLTHIEGKAKPARIVLNKITKIEVSPETLRLTILASPLLKDWRPRE